MSEASPLLALAEEVTRAVDRAVAAKAGDQEQKEFVRLTELTQSHRERLATATFVLRTRALALTDPERERVKVAIAAVRASLTNLREALSVAPAEVRRGPSWVAFQGAAKSATEAVEQTKADALQRLTTANPRPRAGLTALLAPGDPLRAEYRTLTERYETRVGAIEGQSDLDAFLGTCAHLGALEVKIETRSVPSEHLEAWRNLLTGRLRLTDVSPTFSDWLDDAGHSANVIVRYQEQ